MKKLSSIFIVLLATSFCYAQDTISNNLDVNLVSFTAHNHERATLIENNGRINGYSTNYISTIYNDEDRIPNNDDRANRTGQWYYYDNGENVASVGSTNGQFWWGIMFPSGTYSGNAVTKVSAYDYMAMNGTVTIYNDGSDAPANAVRSKNVSFSGNSDFVEFNFDTPVMIDPTKNVWIVFYNASGASHPAAVCNNTGNPNGRWISHNGTDWGDLNDDLSYTFMIRAFFEQYSTINVDFEGLSGQELPADWTTIDADGDGNDWYTLNWIEVGWDENVAHGGDTWATSASFINSALYPDNYFVSPLVKFASGSTFSFWACAQDASWAAEHFGVAISTSSNTNASDFTTVQEWTMTAKSHGAMTKDTRAGGNRAGTWYQYTVDLNDYAGMTGYVAIRHFNCTDMFRLNIDDILLTNCTRIYNYTINSSASPSYGGYVSGSGVYEQGSTCTLHATAYSGYSFFSWSEDGVLVSTDPTYSFYVTRYRNLTANFVPAGGEKCRLVFDLFDSYGDGWNDSKLNVAFNNGLPTQHITMFSGSSVSYELEVDDGVGVSLTWSSGSMWWDSECSFNIHYEDGTIIYQGSNLNSSFSYWFEVNCGIQPPVVGNDGPYCVGETIHLTATGVSGASYSWTGPDGWTSNYQNPNRSNCTMAMAGIYTCTINNSGQSASASTNVVINPKPTANFTTNSPVYFGNATQFTSTSSGQNITSYQWNFGDGHTGTGQSVSHTYSQPGNYQVTHTVQTSSGCSDQITKTVTVNANSDLPLPSVGNDGPYCVGETIHLTANSSTSGVTYQWTGPGGWTSNYQNPNRSNCTMAMAGTYTCTITKNGQTASASTTVTVNPQPIADFTTNNPTFGSPTQFISTAYTNPTGYTINNYYWNFGDGITGSGQNATHTYSQPGSYQVTHTVQMSSGCSDQITKTITVNSTSDLPSPIVGNDGPYCVGETIHLTASSSVSGVSYQWTGPNGWTSNIQNPSRSNCTMAMTGTYTCAITKNGQTASASTTVTVNPQPIADFTTNNPTFGSPTQFISTAYTNPTGYTINNYYWNFGDGITGSGQNATHTYSQPGSYQVTHTVQMSSGCSDQITKTITVNSTSDLPSPIVGNDGPYCVGETIYLTASSSVSGVSYQWTGPNGWTSNAQNPSRSNCTTAMAGSYSCTITKNDQTSASAYTTVTINQSEEEDFYVTECDSYTWHGTNYTQGGTFTFDTQTAQGCPRTETLHLTINDSETEEFNITECNTYTWHGQTYTSSGSYLYETTTDLGCLRTETLHLTINQSEAEEYTVTANGNYTWHDVTYTQSGTYSFESTTAQGCLRIETLHLTVLQGYTISASAGPNGSISPEGDVFVEPGEDQTFDFIPDNGCRVSTVIVDGVDVGYKESHTFRNVNGDHTIYVQFSGLGVDDHIAPNLKIFPNPAQDKINIESPNMKHIAVFNLLGVQIESKDVNDDYAVISTNEFPQGTYILKVEYLDESVGYSRFVVAK